jgi:hypothetical protein
VTISGRITGYNLASLAALWVVGISGTGTLSLFGRSEFVPGSPVGYYYFNSAASTLTGTANTTTVVPEPASWMLFAGGLLAIGAYLGRKRTKVSGFSSASGWTGLNNL